MIWECRMLFRRVDKGTESAADEVWGKVNPKKMGGDVWRLTYSFMFEYFISNATQALPFHSKIRGYMIERNALKYLRLCF